MVVIDPTDEMADAFRRAAWAKPVWIAGQEVPNLREGIAAVLAIVARDQAGPCSSTLDPIVGIVPTWCQLRHGHAGDHESGPTRWKERAP